jgi:hypothetical protein
MVNPLKFESGYFEIVLETDKMDVEGCVEKILDYLPVQYQS